MESQAAPQHAWLERLLGEWRSVGECDMGPGQPKHRAEGRETVRSLGGLWVVAESEGQLPDGGPARMVMTLGYDPRARVYRGTWVGSMMDHLWIYEGQLNAEETRLELRAQGPRFDGGEGMALYRDVIEIVDENHRRLLAAVQGEDGQWTEFMEANYYRIG